MQSNTLQTSRFYLLFCVLGVVLSQTLCAAPAAPTVTKVSLSTPVNPDVYGVVFSNTADPADAIDGIWIDPGNSSGDSTTDPTGVAANPPASAIAAPAIMFGDSSGFGTMLFSISADSVDFGTELAALQTNMPTNHNTDILGAEGPVNKANIELLRAIPAGTEVTFTVNMAGLPPHIVAVIGGSVPTITYDATGDGELIVKTTTTATTSEAGDSFSSIVGLYIYADTTVFGTTPLLIAAQSDCWLGDIYPLLPGVDANAAVSGNGGTVGEDTAKSGLTIYGTKGEQRDISIFLPAENMERLFGSGITADDITAYVNTGEASDNIPDPNYNNFGKDGYLAEFTYTFASPKDATLGVESSTPPTPSPSVTPAKPSKLMKQYGPVELDKTLLKAYGVSDKSIVSIYQDTNTSWYANLTVAGSLDKSTPPVPKNKNKIMKTTLPLGFYALNGGKWPNWDIIDETKVLGFKGKTLFVQYHFSDGYYRIYCYNLTGSGKPSKVVGSISNIADTSLNATSDGKKAWVVSYLDEMEDSKGNVQDAGTYIQEFDKKLNGLYDEHGKLYNAKKVADTAATATTTLPTAKTRYNYTITETTGEIEITISK